MRQGAVSRDPTPGRLRVAFLGDSYLRGIGVADNERVSEVLARTAGVESLNFGVSGYGPAQYYLLADKVASFRPDLVLVFFCLANDFSDNVVNRRYGYFKPYFTLDRRGALALEGYPIKNVKKFGVGTALYQENPLRHSRVLRLGYAFLRDFFSKGDVKGLTLFSEELIYRPKPMTERESRELSEAITIHEKALAAIRDKFRSHDIPWIIVTAPTKCEYHPQCQYGNVEQNTKAFEVLRRSADALGIELIDTVSVLDGEDFWKVDAHWNPRGHQKIAARIHQYLKAKQYLP
jgi:lysophospholipase L1-like esterase